MNKNSRNLLSTLSLGKVAVEAKGTYGNDIVRTLANAYEVARNALEYRADHLVRRAAIERILKRQMLFARSAQQVAETLLVELQWARYVADPASESKLVRALAEVIEKYEPALGGGKLERDWVIGIISAEIEEKLNLNVDYHKFTAFAFHVIRPRVDVLGVENLDLLLYVAIDKVYSQADNQQVAYHLLKLIRSQVAESTSLTMEQLLFEAKTYYELAVRSATLNRLSVFVRKQIGPLVLIRDMYFANPERFGELLENEPVFSQNAELVLEQQMSRMRSRLSRATVRSLVYVFLTKMLLVLLIELPVERLFRGAANLGTLAANLTLPVVIMWILTSRIRLPSGKDQEVLRRAAADLVFVDDLEVTDEEKLLTLEQKGTRLMFVLYYLFYGLLFMLIFAALVGVLTWAGFSFVSLIIFIFFLCLVTFFAFRIKQTSAVYSYKPKSGGSSFIDNLMLPIVTVGGMLSQGVSRLNFLVFLFDFVLESPFKMILHFLDKWFTFLTVKKDEVVG